MNGHEARCLRSCGLPANYLDLECVMIVILGLIILLVIDVPLRSESCTL